MELQVGCCLFADLIADLHVVTSSKGRESMHHASSTLCVIVFGHHQRKFDA
jgi:hypothetical protein